MLVGNVSRYRAWAMSRASSLFRFEKVGAIHSLLKSSTTIEPIPCATELILHVHMFCRISALPKTWILNDCPTNRVKYN
jgi:hypothetical protein